MSQWNDAGIKGFPVNSALSQFRRVIRSAGYLAYAGTTDVELGTLQNDTFTSGTQSNSGQVRLRSKQGTEIMVASEAITVNNPVYAAANGKVAASGTLKVGIALETVTADGDHIEILRTGNGDVAASVGGTTASAFLVDSDATTPRIELAAQTGGTGNFKGTVKPPATLTADRVFTLPSDSDQTLVGATAMQTLTNKTLTAPAITNPVITDTPGASTAAAGSTTSDAGVLPAGTSRVYPTTAADDTKGVRVHATDKVTGRMIFIGNGVANKILKVYAPSGGTINGGSADAAFSSASGKGVVLFCLDSTGNTWLAW